ncbi:hypothetical protein E7Z53_19300 [Kocuria salina]|jgi:hypothetical protein|uniref:hypothetical protein n=1 Tax=Kocuria salina TaxID=1929416 RepID=UPI001592DEE4|nr:hypothetical protein [Kocuria salina]NVC25560.1 hypothetical protein [Kocuria salina]
MSDDVHVERIWWRNVPKGEFYNVERHPNVTKGGQGSLYFEVPESLTPKTLDFLGVSNIESLPYTIQAGLADEIDSGITWPIEFRRKSNTSPRIRIARQNRQMTGAQRHPAWDRTRGFPSAPDGVQNSSESDPHFPDGGLRIYIAKTADGDYYAGFTTGRRPTDMDEDDPAWDLYSQGRIVGGVIDARDGAA